VSNWTPAELDAIGGSDELRVATRRADESLRSSRIIWVVRHDDQLYVRSVNGRDAAWFRGAQTRHEGHIAAGGVEKDVTLVDADPGLNDDLDVAYRRKYGHYADATDHITAEAARDTTLRLEPS
jgi:hypothetical protein